MENASENRVREARARFKLDGAGNPDDAGGAADRQRATPAKPLRAKVFKSGNSLALRLPAALGLEAGMEMILTAGGQRDFHARPAPTPGRKFDIDAIWGIAKNIGLQPIKPEDRVFEELKRPWDDPDWPGWGNGEA
ncbi:MAG: hypothetical protein ABIM50_03800 [Novosphingobium sp.]